MSFSDLPLEIQFVIGSFLWLHDLTIAVRVCQLWHRIFEPALWKHIGASASWSMQEMVWQDCFETSLEAGYLTRYGRSLYSLYLTTNPFRLKAFLERSPGSTPFPHLKVASLECIEDDEDVAAFIGRCGGGVSGWKSLSFDGTCASLCFGERSAKALLNHVGTLESFTLVPRFRFPNKDIHQLLCSAPRLEKLNLVGTLQKRGQNIDGRLDAHDIVTQTGYAPHWRSSAARLVRSHARTSQGPSPNDRQASSQNLARIKRASPSSARYTHNWDDLRS